MEELLNKLIEKGWKPFGNEKVYKIKVYKIKLLRPEKEIIRIELSKGRGEAKGYTTVRAICSKESGLWQFVCENKMVELDTYSGDSDSYLCYYNIDGYPKDDRFEMERDDYRFRLIESALKDESGLEQFLLNTIKV